MSSIPSDINCIIFDLGGVLIDLSPVETANRFAAISGISIDRVFHAYQSNPEFNAYERGEINDDQFRNFIRKTFSLDSTDAEIDACWNAMLRGFPSSKQSLVEKLKAHFKTIVLSNTNEVHLKYIEENMLEGRKLDAFFHQAYYSHKINMRKPELEIYRYVLRENNLDPAKTVFLDDNADNLKAANQVGIHTIHITNPDHVYDLFHSL